MLKIVADKYIPFLRGRLESVGVEVEYIDPSEFTAARVREAHGLLIRTRTKINAALLEGSRVCFVATCTIGMDQFDLAYCRRAGIRAVNAPGCNAPAVAQWVWGSLLYAGVEPRGLRVGVVGHGHVGGIVARWGELLGAEVWLCDPFRQGSEYRPFEALLHGCDIVTLHTPLTRGTEHATYHMVDVEQLAMMRPGSILVNAARGPVVSGRAAAGAGHVRLLTDVWEGEPGALNPLQLERSEVATPHIAGYSLEGKQRATRMALEGLCAHFSLRVPDVSDLAGPYRMPEKLDAASIIASYSPAEDMRALRAAPERFEWLRDNYVYRREL